MLSSTFVFRSYIPTQTIEAVERAAGIAVWAEDSGEVNLDALASVLITLPAERIVTFLEEVCSL